MIYFVSKQKQLFNSDSFVELDINKALKIINSWEEFQFDTETTGRDPHICDILLAQFGKRDCDIQIVVDCTTYDIKLFKSILETKLIIGHNLKFDLQFLYKHGIKPLKVYDTMIIEQLLYLGYDPEYFRVALQAVALRRLGVDLDKSIRGQIIYLGITTEVILYAATDVVYLEDIKEQQLKELKEKKLTNGMYLENQFVPVIAYLEWCGIKLSVSAWRKYMDKNQKAIEESLKDLNDWLIKKSEIFPNLKKYVYINKQGDLFSGFDLTPKVSINWSSAKQVIVVAKTLGFNLSVSDKKTGASKESVAEKVLSKQKGIDDEFLNKYFNYTGAVKAASTYGQTYIDAINPKTGRIHTVFKQLGAASGRMSCGGGKSQFNTDLAKLKGISPNKCIYPQIQNLPAEEEVRSAFVSEENNLICSCDYSALESRLGADIYNEQSMIDEYLYGSGDIHSLTAKHCFKKELEGIAVKDIRDVRPDLRKKAKPVEFSQQFGGSANAIQNALGCSKEEAKEIARAYNEGFKGITEFKQTGKLFVQKHGYILINPITGHKLFWENFNLWKDIEKVPEEERLFRFSSKTLEEMAIESSKYFNRLSLNAPTQGTGIIILKYATILFFKWLINNNLFNIVKLCNLVHDEVVIEFPANLKNEVPSVLKKCMEHAASVFCKKLPIPAVPEVADHWVH